MNRIRPLSHLLLLLALATLGPTGCSDDDPMGPSGPSFTHSATTTTGDLRLTVATDAATYEFGETVRVRVTLTNVGDTPQTLDFARGNPARFPNLGVNLNDEDDVVHHAAGDGERDVFELAAGTSIEASFDWDQNSRFTRSPVERGTFRVVAFVGFDDRDTIRVDDLFLMLD